MKPSIHYSLGWGFFFRFSFLFSVVFYVGARGRMLSRPEGEKQQLKTRVSAFQHFIPVKRKRREKKKKKKQKKKRKKKRKMMKSL